MTTPVNAVPVPPVPVLLLHGWGGSFASTWQRSGFTELLRDAGRPIIGVDLLGHGDAPKPHDTAAYADLTGRVLDAMPAEPIDAIGFSLGAMTLLRIACDQPHRFRKLVLAGVGRNLFEPDEAAHKAILDALEGHGADDSNLGRMFLNYAEQPGNDRIALMAVMQQERNGLEPERLANATCETLVAIGDKDFAGPGDPLVALLPNATLKVLRNVDHFATPEAFAFIDAALEFLDALPT